MSKCLPNATPRKFLAMHLAFDLQARMHRGEITPREAFRLQAERDSLPSPLPSPTPSPAEGKTPGPDLCVYTPYSATGNLGASYNRIMARLTPGEWAVFLDHDAMSLLNDFWTDLQHAIAKHPDAGAICCWTNRTGNPYQKAKAPPHDDIAQHTAYALAIRRQYGQKTTDITGNRLTGVLFAVSRVAWDRVGPFVDGFGEVDNSWAHQCRAAGLRLWRMDGVYVYHQRRTNGWKGATRPEIDCRGAAWTYAKVAPIIQAHGSDTLRELAAAHESLVESRGDWSECQKGARRRTLLAHWRETLRLTVCIPSREEPEDELAATVQSFREGGAHEIIVIDDASTIPVTNDCGADLILRHDTAHGVSASRNEGLARAAGNVIAFSDSHCRIAENCDLLAWAFDAYNSPDLLCAVCGSYENLDTWYWGCELLWRDWRNDISANRVETHQPQGLFGSVYSAARWTWERLGGWVPTRGWGYNEQALSLACKNASVPIRVDPAFRIRHKFRNNKRFPYPVSGRDTNANAPWTHWLLSTDAEWAALRPTIQQHKPDALARAETWIADPGAAELRQAYALRRATPIPIRLTPAR